LVKGQLRKNKKIRQTNGACPAIIVDYTQLFSF